MIGKVSFIHAIIIDATLLKATSTRKKQLEDVDLIEKDPRARVPINLAKGAVYVRKFKEAVADGTILEGYQNPIGTPGVDQVRNFGCYRRLVVSISNGTVNTHLQENSATRKFQRKIQKT